ncbi:MAG: hypothetical protein AABZ60_09790 [Planctomycetota bacterium]
MIRVLGTFWIMLCMAPCFLIYAQEIQLSHTGPFSAWSPASVTIRFHNTSDQPLFLLDYEIQSAGQILYHSGSHREYMGCIEPEKAQLSLKIEMDEPGAAARVPNPPKVSEWGDVPMIEVSVIPPGKFLESTFSFLATYNWRGPLTITANFAVANLTLYKLSKIENKTPKRTQKFVASGYTYTDLWAISYFPQEKAPTQPPTALDFPFVAPQWILPEALVVKEAFEQKQSLKKSLIFQCEILSPEFDRPQALAAAKTGLSQALHSWSVQTELENHLQYFNHGKIWWYIKNISEQESKEMGTSQSTTYFFGKGFQCALEGDYSHFLTTANLKDSQQAERYLVYNHTSEDEPNTQVKAMIDYFQDVLHLKTQFGRLKGGGIEVFVEVPGNRLVPFLLEYASFQKNK